jgi:hypothetical protein
MPYAASCALALPAVHCVDNLASSLVPAVEGGWSQELRRWFGPATIELVGDGIKVSRPPAAEAMAGGQERAHSWQSVGPGLLSELFRLERIEEELARQGLEPGRGRLTSARTVYLMLGLCVFSRASYQEVLARLWPAMAGADDPVPNKSSLCRARFRLGAQVMAGLFRSMSHPLATPAATTSEADVDLSRLRLMAIDGLTKEVPDSPANEQAFGGQRDKRGRRVGFPQVRLVGLVECATHVFVDAALGAYGDGEQELAALLARSLTKDMLVLADRGFLSVCLWRAYRDAGAHLLWRIKGDVATKVDRRLPDGTYLARVRPSNKPGRWPPGQRPAPITVRVIEYHVDGSHERFRLATSLLDPDLAPALQLARLYPHRWQFETTADELKTHQRGSGVVLRSTTPDGVHQEVWAHLLLHLGARTLMYEAAATLDDGPDPARISFTTTLSVIQRSILARIPPRLNLPHQMAAAIAELTQPRALVSRRHRPSYPRSVKHPSSRYPGRSASTPLRSPRTQPRHVHLAPRPLTT